jgi:outer membrane protein TolC
MDGFAHEFDAAVRDQLRFDFLDYTLGFQFQVAIGNREARAITTRTQLQRLQAITQYRGLVDKITAEVHNAQVDVEAAWNQIVAGRRWRLAAQEELRRLEIDEKNRPEGMSPSFIQTKLDAQDRYAEAQRQEINAIATYNINLSALEQAKGTLLRYDNVTLEEDPQPTVPLTWHAPDWKIWKR